MLGGARSAHPSRVVPVPRRLPKEAEMSVNLQAERLYDQVELVRGAGSRNRGQLCIMSFVAYLGGERHTDHPRTASSFIHDFAIPLNDGISTALRQQLK